MKDLTRCKQKNIYYTVYKYEEMISLLLTLSSLWIENVTSLLIFQEHYKGTACNFHKMALLTLSLIKNNFWFTHSFHINLGDTRSKPFSAAAVSL